MKRAARQGHVGDVVHFSKFFDERGIRDWQHDIWGVIAGDLNEEATSNRATLTFKVRIVTGVCAGQLHTAASDYDSGHLVKPDDVPDYVWSRIAFYSLMGDDDAD